MLARAHVHARTISRGTSYFLFETYLDEGICNRVRVRKGNEGLGGIGRRTDSSLSSHCSRIIPIMYGSTRELIRRLSHELVSSFHQWTLSHSSTQWYFPPDQFQHAPRPSPLCFQFTIRFRAVLLMTLGPEDGDSNVRHSLLKELHRSFRIRRWIHSLVCMWNEYSELGNCQLLPNAGCSRSQLARFLVESKYIFIKYDAHCMHCS